MLLAIPALLTPAQVADLRAVVEAGEWRDGRMTAGVQSALAKNNLQLANGSAAALTAGGTILEALAANALFQSAALPRRIVPPLFNRYDSSSQHHFGEHVDNALRPLPGGGRIRTDLSATVFLSGAGDYDGGELVIEDSYGSHSVKLEAGDMILYPSTSLHRVEPVTRGSRLASFFWIESMVREDSQRTLLLDMDAAIRTLASEVGDGHRAVVSLTGTYHNLLRRWADA
ncbi:Fe2+-dependent dioxygenase [Sphingomonas rhizophila]|uniref:Fe2+-dependent dioxygenase n=1 Tax=Sphingomonas rhizophila TaxID=2071607 RepID=A0A7G9S9N2_9SPHN|nr:Fe2+-dependent dioxygenase [Sphingomonas rhizophila]QNN64557.1 Fe2+-dependent dioxygenase [Sphingomonas rhizophila]